MAHQNPDHDDFIHSEEFLHHLMRRQLRGACADNTSTAVAALAHD
jgi:hypothetical protein